MTDFTVTLRQIRAHYPCRNGWQKLLAARGFAEGRFDPDHRVTLGDIAQSNGADDAFWVATRVEEEMPRDFIRLLRECAYRAAKRASVHTTDQRVHDCLTAVRQHLDGALDVDLAAAEAAARDAAAAAAAAEAAARDAAAAAWAAAGAAAGAAGTAERAAKTAAERSAQVADLIELFGVTECGQ